MQRRPLYWHYVQQKHPHNQHRDYANVCSLRNKFYELRAFVDKLSSLNIAVIKTWLIHDFDITSELSRYHYLRSDRQRHKKTDGVLIHIVNNINISYFAWEPRDNGITEVINCKLTSWACDIISDHVKTHTNVWVANISANHECAALTSWSVDTSSSVEEPWFISNGQLSSFMSSLLSCLVQRRQNNCSPWIIKQVKRLLGCRKTL